MNIPVISQLPQDIATAVLVLLLVVVFVVAFKVMKMVFETIAVSALSAGFYAVLSILLNYTFSFNQMLSYAFFGATLYMVYSFLASAYSLARTALSIPYHLLVLIGRPVKKGFGYIRKEYRLWKISKDKKSSTINTGEDDDEDSSSSTKEVIIDKVKDE